eukprot:9394229-Alexandrium_andersonii.AAC.1
MIAEKLIDKGVPEQRTKGWIKEAEAKTGSIIGPATAGGIEPGCIRIGNTGGTVSYTHLRAHETSAHL